MLALFVMVVGALAGQGTTSPAPPVPPTVDFSSVESRADVQPLNRERGLHPVHARLLSDRTEVAPGTTFRLGVYLEQKKGWHTYWMSPGDIGLPTDITWTLPKGMSAAPYTYPTPLRFEVEGLVSFGYNDQILLFADITVPADAVPGSTLAEAEVEWLVCETSCIPGKASLALPIVVGSGGQPTPWAPLFDHFEAQHPIGPGDVGLSVHLVLSEDAVLPYKPFKAALKLSGGSGKVVPNVEAYPFAPIIGEGWGVNEQTIGMMDGALIVQFDAETYLEAPPKSDRIGGLFQVLVDGEPKSILAEFELPWKPKGTVLAPIPSMTLTGVLSPIPGLTKSAPSEAHSKEPKPVESREPVQSSAAAASTSDFGLIANLFFAFFGGLLLNIMPCVLPVLTLKLYSLVEQTDITPREQRIAGLSYTAGIVVSFVALAASILVARSALGGNVGWGFQFQYPPYVAGLVTIVFAFGLSLFGVFEIPAIGSGAASEAGAKEGPIGYFFTGVFATLLATPCSAPILGSATAYAISASAPELVAIFVMIGLGLGFPFLLISFVPALYKLLPRPGAWMETFKQLLGFTLIATTIWLLGVLGAQIGMDRLMSFIAFLAFVSLGCWVFGRFGGVAASLQKQAGAALAGAVVMGIGGFFYVDLAFAEPACDDGITATASELDFSSHIPWQPFSEQRVADLAGSTIFIDFTAEWCLTCKINEKTVLETATVRNAMAKHNVVPLKADWTRQDETISKWLNRYGKAGVPFYLVIPAKGEPIALGEVITPGGVTAALQAASLGSF